MLSDPGKQAESIRELVKNAALVADELKRNLLLKSIAKKFNLREKLLENELDKFLKANSRTTIDRQKTSVQKTINTGETEKVIDIKPSPVEKDLIKLLFEGDAEVTGWVFDSIIPDEFISPVHRQIAETVFDCYKKNIYTASEMIEKFEDEEIKSLIMKMTIDTNSISKRWDESFEDQDKNKKLKEYSLDVIKKYKLLQIDRLIKENNARILRSEGEEEQKEILSFNLELQSEKKRIQNSEEFEGV
jgi:DNA primase